MFSFDESNFSKEIKLVGCESIQVTFESLKPFQGRLKTLSAENYQKLKYRILKNGFRYPPFIWRDGKENYILDGHQRVAAIKKMITEGYSLESGEITVIDMPASTYDDAREMVLELISQFGTVQEDGFYDFTSGLDIEFDSFDFPKMDSDIPDGGWESDLGDIDKLKSHTDGIKKIIKIEVDQDEDLARVKDWVKTQLLQERFNAKVI